jgi:hypothetical protein
VVLPEAYKLKAYYLLLVVESVEHFMLLSLNTGMGWACDLACIADKLNTN